MNARTNPKALALECKRRLHGKPSILYHYRNAPLEQLANQMNLQIGGITMKKQPCKSVLMRRNSGP